MSKELGKRILSALKEMNMTQKELALTIGVKEDVISRYISGDREPKSAVLANIATALHTTSDWLLGIDCGEYNHAKIKVLLARNAKDLSDEQKKELLNAIFNIK